jgi:hypothetical protein
MELLPKVLMDEIALYVPREKNPPSKEFRDAYLVARKKHDFERLQKMLFDIEILLTEFIDDIEISLTEYLDSESMTFPPDWITLFHRHRYYFIRSEQEAIEDEENDDSEVPNLDDKRHLYELCMEIIQDNKGISFDNYYRNQRTDIPMYNIISLCMFLRPEKFRIFTETVDDASFYEHVKELCINVVTVYDETRDFFHVSDDISSPIPSSEGSKNPIEQEPVFHIKAIEVKKNEKGKNGCVKFVDETSPKELYHATGFDLSVDTRE